MAIMARAANLRGYRELIDELGGDGTGLLRRFGITPEAIADDDALIFAESLSRALKVAMDFLDRNYPGPDRSMTTRVRSAIDRAFLESHADIDTVARMITVHERTLQRALAAEGTTFTAVLDEARRDAAHRLLCQTDLPMSRITTLIGLREQSALTRAVRRWYGQTPQQLRSAARSPESRRTPTGFGPEPATGR
ncbi:helix-turn-helix transcriptional regulator [Nocardia tengchongensis]|uniref:helix-turn-helix transcriptional regulator n=1 Tax=Nocardia tengchongensis TaxID=2055889 RepID=UPI003673D7B9